ncbi:MAG: hypothetical protein E6Q40_10205 [Cupriavidus sp.]|nr:MAG: hypothetical protein E6Q40_10205 [Cupriavidus sp.]
MTLRDLTPTQRELAEFMSHLSERSYRAGWMSGIERELWTGMQKPGSSSAPIWLTSDETQRLKALSAQCGGWIVFDDILEETFVPLIDWEARFGGSPVNLQSRAL